MANCVLTWYILGAVSAVIGLCVWAARDVLDELEEEEEWEH